MNISEAIDFLKKKGYSVIKECNYFRLFSRGMELECWTGWKKENQPNWSCRDIIKFARDYRDSNSQPSIGKNVKKFSSDKDRTATRDAIKKGDFDKIPSNKRTANDSRWNWD